MSALSLKRCAKLDRKTLFILKKKSRKKKVLVYKRFLKLMK